MELMAWMFPDEFAKDGCKTYPETDSQDGQPWWTSYLKKYSNQIKKSKE